MYVKNGESKLEGITWFYEERSPYAGTIITAFNKLDIIKEKAREYKKDNPELSTEECVIKAKDFVLREKKHYEAYLKGKNYYHYKGQKRPVMSDSRVERFKKYAEEIQSKWDNMPEDEKNKYLNLNKEEE